MKNSIMLFTIVVLSSLFVATPSTMSQSPPIANQWTWPLGGDGYLYEIRQSSKYGTTLENTDYQVRNLDLVHRGGETGDDHINCFEVGFHRQWHAGVDLYRVGASTAGASVHAVANGTVYYAADLNYPGSVVIIEHILPDNSKVYSVYAHLNPGSVTVSQGQIVNRGDILGTIILDGHTGRYPEFHPDGDDSHLHFEIRSFGDGTNLFPNNPSCNVFPPAIGYTYPDFPDVFGYLDPMQFLDDRIPDPPRPYRVYLPAILSDESCTEGQNLIQYNPGFEFPVDRPAPWFEVTTYFDPPSTYYYHIVDDDSFHAYAGYHSAFFGDQVFFARIVDEEMLQSVRIPGGVTSSEWVQYIKLEGPYSYGTDIGDRFILALKDAETGVSLINDEVIDHTSTNYPNNAWLRVTITINNAGVLANRSVSPSYSSINDGDTTASTMRVDEVSLITHCGGTQSANNASGSSAQIRIEPVDNPPSQR